MPPEVAAGPGAPAGGATEGVSGGASAAPAVEAPAPPLVVIGGPTATGKTGLSLRLADALAERGIGAEIISADSRQVYRGLDIGTAKVTPAERARIPHHGLDLVDPDEPFSVADFVRHARAALAGIAARGRVALLVGGTGLYLRAVARGLEPDALPHDPELRARLEAELRSTGLAPLVERLRRIAPGRAAAVDLANPRRVVRALEAALLVGDRPPPPFRSYPGRAIFLVLDVEPATHRAWIAARARAQFEAGLLDEAAALRARYDPKLPAFSAIGYREAWAVLDGRCSLEAAIELDARRNVAFARRQRIWFRREPEAVWLDATEDPLERVVALVRPVVEGDRARTGGRGGERGDRRAAR
ncbi:MAG TPA: tRNA (adenosine(37)-N6)-dimethylallyltransferase MiaA [Candidatus Binatia bacterium]|nr:tRNA (adenosine(37)-N6)-dimethylallyltransferase MiaA [Candidatus Binatia bacterium]